MTFESFEGRVQGKAFFPWGGAGNHLGSRSLYIYRTQKSTVARVKGETPIQDELQRQDSLSATGKRGRIAQKGPPLISRYTIPA